MFKEEIIDKAIASLEKEIKNVDTVINMGEDIEFYRNYKKDLKKQVDDLKDDLINLILLCEEDREAVRGLTMLKIKHTKEFYALRQTMRKLSLWPSNLMEILR